MLGKDKLTQKDLWKYTRGEYTDLHGFSRIAELEMAISHYKMIRWPYVVYSDLVCVQLAWAHSQAGFWTPVSPLRS